MSEKLEKIYPAFGSQGCIIHILIFYVLHKPNMYVSIQRHIHLSGHTGITVVKTADSWAYNFQIMFCHY